MTLTQLDALLEYIEARVEESEACMQGATPEEMRLIRIRAYQLRNEVRVAFYPPPEHAPTDEELGGP